MNLYENNISRYLRVETMLAIIVFSTVYAALRYNIFGKVLWSWFPLFTLNKSISFTGLTFLVISFALPSNRNMLNNSGVSYSAFKKTYGIWGLALTIIHSIISFILLNPVYYKKFYFESGQLTTSASISLIAGILALLVLIYFQFTFSTIYKKKLSYYLKISKSNILLFVILLTTVHITFIGYTGWFIPQSWPGYLPPITLLTSIVIVAGLAVKYRKKSSITI